MIKYFFVLLMTLAGSLGAFFFKKSTADLSNVFSLLRIPSFYLGGFLYCLGALLNVFLLRYMDYTIVYPIGSIAYIWSLIISNRFLGEKITGKKIVGVSLICVGVVLLTR